MNLIMRFWPGVGGASVALLGWVWIAHGMSEKVQLSIATDSYEEPLIKKTVFSSRLRLVFFAGLEGTGHHYMSHAFTTMYETSGIEMLVCCDIAHSIYLPSAMSTTLVHYQDSEERLRSALRQLVSMENELRPEGTVVTFQNTNLEQQGQCLRRHGEISFPNGHGPNKALSYADIQLLASVAEEEGIDFRILYMQRPAERILLSTVGHRHFHNHLKGLRVEDDSPDEAKFLEYMRILLTDAAVLHSNLAELGCGFIVCHSYDRLAEEEQASMIAKFLSPTDVVADHLKASLISNAASRKRRAKNETLKYVGVDAVTQRLQRKLDVMESQLCNPGCN